MAPAVPNSTTSNLGTVTVDIFTMKFDEVKTKIQNWIGSSPIMQRLKLKDSSITRGFMKFANWIENGFSDYIPPARNQRFDFTVSTKERPLSNPGDFFEFLKKMIFQSYGTLVDLIAYVGGLIQGVIAPLVNDDCKIDDLIRTGFNSIGIVVKNWFSRQFNIGQQEAEKCKLLEKLSCVVFNFALQGTSYNIITERAASRCSRTVLNTLQIRYQNYGKCKCIFFAFAFFN